MNPKILVGCPTSGLYEFCLDEYVKAVKSLTYKNYDVLLVDNSKDDNYKKKIQAKGLKSIKGPYFESAMKRITESRNLLRKYFLENNYDYLFSLEQDVIPPKDVIEKLLKHNKKIIAGIYFMPIKEEPNKIKFKPVLWDFPTEEQWQATLEDPFMKKKIDEKKATKEDMRRQFTAEEVKESKVIEVKTSGLGCILIHKDVLEKVSFRNKPGVKCFDDVYFCIDARSNNFKVYADTSIKCEHLFLKKPWHWEDLKF